MDKKYLAAKLEECLGERGAFFSEADFHLSLALAISREYELHLEYSVPQECKLHDRAIYLDIVAADKNTKKIFGIELKYKTIETELIDSILKRKAKHVLKNQSARDLGSYGYLKDIERLKKLLDAGFIDEGFAIFLTNDKGYWLNDGSNCSYKDFNLKENRAKDSIPKIMNWHPECMKENEDKDKSLVLEEFKEKHKKDYYVHPISGLKDILICDWQPKSEKEEYLGVKKSFRYLINTVE